MWDVSVWLGDTENTPPFLQAPVASSARHRIPHQTARQGAITPAKRRHFMSVDGNAGYMAERRASPRKGTEKKSGAGELGVLDEDNGNTTRLTRVGSQKSIEQTAKRTVASIVLDARFKDLPPPDRANTASSRTRSSVSRASGKTSRSKSPVKDAVDLLLADVPIHQHTREEVGIPKVAETLCGRLEDIAEGDGLVPKIIAELMEKHGDIKLRPRHLAITESPFLQSDVEDFKQLLDIWEDARQLESDNAYEAAWNSEVHSRVLILALRPHKKRIRHFNITEARPVLAFLPTRASTTSESQLVDYSINIIPSIDEAWAVRQLIATQAETQSTITQTLTTAVRTRPCVVSIETKTDSGNAKAKIQLAVWSAAHFARLRSLFDLSQHEEEGSLSIHPVIHVQLHDWKLYLVVERQGGKYIDEINLGLCIGGTYSLLELWKLRASLRCLARWAEEEYWPVLWSQIEGKVQK